MKVLLRDGKCYEAGFDQPEGRQAFWHTSAHILAQAVKRLYPETKCAIGPAIENGFYYDFDVEKPFSEEDLAKLEEEMKKADYEPADVVLNRLRIGSRDTKGVKR